jgi:glycosyltransferase 2 family protein
VLKYQASRPTRGGIYTVMNRRSRIILFVIGFALLAWLLHKFDMKAVFLQLREFDSYFLLLVIFSFFKNFLRTTAWQMSMGTGERHPGFWILFWARLAGESAAYLSSGNLFVGEPVKIMLLRDRLHLETGITSILLERAIYSFTATLVLLAGLLYTLTRFSLFGPTGLAAITTSIALVALIFVALFAFRREWPLLTLGMKLARKLPLVGKKLSDRHHEAAAVVERRLYDYRRNYPARFYLVFTFDLIFNLTTVLEVYLIFHGLGAKITYMEALLVEALTKMGNLLFFIPAGIGLNEAWNIVLARMLKRSDQIGLMVALIRRFYSFFWVILGLIAFLSFGNRSKVEDRRLTTKTQRHEEQKEPL